MSNVYCATKPILSLPNPLNAKAQQSNLTKSHERKESPKPINGQEDEIDPHHPAPSLPELKGHRQVPDDEQHRCNDTDERHGPRHPAVIRAPDDERQEDLHAGEEERQCGG